MSADSAALRQQLQRILDGPSLARSEKLRRLLAYIVDRSLSEDRSALKGYAIGVDVFDRNPASFDPASDSIVRVQVGRLRAAIAEYYEDAGRYDPVLIEIPKGGYVARFTLVDVEAQTAAQEEHLEDTNTAPPEPHEIKALGQGDQDETTHEQQSSGQEDPVLGGSIVLALLVLLALAVWGGKANEADLRSAIAVTTTQDVGPRGVVLTVSGFADIGEDGIERGQADALTQDVVTALSKGNDLIVRLENNPEGSALEAPSRQVEGRLHYRIHGGLRRYDDGLRVTILLQEYNTQATIWSASYDRADAPMAQMQDGIVSDIALDVRPRVFIHARQTLEETPITEQTPWELYLRATFTPGSQGDTLMKEQERISLVQRAITLDSELGEAHSVLAERLIFVSIFDPPSDSPDIVSAAQAHAAKAIETARNNADAMFNVALHYVLMGEGERALTMMKRVLELDPNHPMANYLVSIIPYYCQPMPDDVVNSLIRYETELSLDHPMRAQILYAIARAQVLRGELEGALDIHGKLETLGAKPQFVIQHAAILNALGKKAEAVQLINDYRHAWPNLSATHYANVFIPRLCNGEPDPEGVRLFTSLAETMTIFGRN